MFDMNLCVKQSILFIRINSPDGRLESYYYQRNIRRKHRCAHKEPVFQVVISKYPIPVIDMKQKSTQPFCKKYDWIRHYILYMMFYVTGMYILSLMIEDLYNICCMTQEHIIMYFPKEYHIDHSKCMCIIQLWILFTV